MNRRFNFAVLVLLVGWLWTAVSVANDTSVAEESTDDVEKVASDVNKNAKDKLSQQQPAEPILLANGHFSLVPPRGWIKKKPRTRIVQYEFAVPKQKDDPADGRVTIMGAGGGVKANIDRWLGQFKQADGTPTKDRAKITKKEIAKQEVHLVDMAGTFEDRPRGPFGPSIKRDNYRMIGAIVVSQDKGQYFLKIYGPAKTIAAAAPSFYKFVESLKVGGASK